MRETTAGAIILNQGATWSLVVGVWSWGVQRFPGHGGGKGSAFTQPPPLNPGERSRAAATSLLHHAPALPPLAREVRGGGVPRKRASLPLCPLSLSCEGRAGV